LTDTGLQVGGKQDRKLGPWRFWNVRDAATEDEQAAIVRERQRQGATPRVKHVARRTQPLRRCPRCGQRKRLSAFRAMRGDVLHSACRKCRAVQRPSRDLG
jgi:hypothetical protein